VAVPTVAMAATSVVLAATALGSTRRQVGRSSALTTILTTIAAISAEVGGDLGLGEVGGVEAVPTMAVAAVVIILVVAAAAPSLMR